MTADQFIIDASGVCFTYQEGTQALADVDFRVRSGEFVAMLASNGSGKTTLIKVLVGLLKPQAGKIRIHGEDIGAIPRIDLYQRMGLVFQNPNDQLFAPQLRRMWRLARETWDWRNQKSAKGSLRPWRQWPQWICEAAQFII